MHRSSGLCGWIEAFSVAEHRPRDANAASWASNDRLDAMCSLAPPAVFDRLAIIVARKRGKAE